jgi:hypothetical protein
MPPEPRHEDSFSRMLDPLNNGGELITARGSLLFFESRQDFVEILNGFVVFPLFPQFFASHEVLRDALLRREHYPAFSALDTRVPGTRTERVLVHLAARPLGPDQKPTMRGRLAFS